MINASALVTTPTLIGERIRLVPLEPRHAQAVFESLQDPEGNRLTGTHRTFTLEQIERFCATRAEQDDRLDFAIESLDTGEYAGGLAVNGIDADNESGGFRIDLVEKYRGQGIGPEAIELMLRYAFEEVGLHRVSLEVFEFNDRARRSYEKCGFVLEGRMRDALMWDGKRYDTLIMSILRPEWGARTS
ncbi:GNAT family N-acetyltransferase [Jiangella asiatica]|uniref:N-acetyltransferase n=1 Tax=Jiangella asiatica TaxID=2530372 RepID=A0A4R5CQL6_9ACTN|nr:GNAT family protein [Jiangella asiatica]TDE01620.1 N-acetyltransferase [Jiangella asiatica]